MEIEIFDYKIPIVWLDTNIIIDIARAKNNSIQQKEIKERALKIYDTIYKLTRKKRYSVLRESSETNMATDYF